jgi:hypothetical protein
MLDSYHLNRLLRQHDRPVPVFSDVESLVNVDRHDDFQVVLALAEARGAPRCAERACR